MTKIEKQQTIKEMNKHHRNDIIYDFDEWFSNQKTDVLGILRCWYINLVPENVEEELLEYSNELKKYVDGFVLTPVYKYGETLFATKMFHADTFYKVVEFMKELRENNKLVFLYMIYKINVEPNEEDDVQEPYSIYKLRYAVLND
jgi:hypothetical protein